MESSKIPSKYHVSINFLDQKKTVFSIPKNFKSRTFSYLVNMILHAKENIIFHQLFGSKKDRIFHLRKVQNKNFSVLSKHGILFHRNILLFFFKLKDHASS